MKITKYPQSCLMIDVNNKKILIDPGSLKYEEKFLKEWEKADYIFVTHKHRDHLNYDVVKNINKPIYSTNEVQNTYPEIEFNIIKEKDILKFDNITVEVVKAIHGYNPLLKGDKEVFENIGYIIDDGNNRLYVTSDTICFKNDYKCDIVALPITAHGLTMSSFEASLFAGELGAKLVLPVHMDNDALPTDLDYMYQNFERFNINYKLLEIGESLEV